MPKPKQTATYARSSKTGQWVVRKSSGEVSQHTVKSKTARLLSQSSHQHKDALKRLANR